MKMGAIESDMFVVLTLRAEEEISEEYKGLVNHGNTCYMNSYLQMLFNLTKFREIIFSA